MNRAMLAASLIAFASFYQQASARIGETLEQCQARYGNPVEVTKTMTRFKKGDMNIMVGGFYNGKVDNIAYCKGEKNDLGIFDEMSENEIQNFLKANGGEKGWNKSKKISMNKEWLTEDGEIFAVYVITTNILFICTKKWIAGEEAKTKAEENKKLEGF